jgi:hypothetical protein
VILKGPRDLSAPPEDRTALLCVKSKEGLGMSLRSRWAKTEGPRVSWRCERMPQIATIRHDININMTLISDTGRRELGTVLTYKIYQNKLSLQVRVVTLPVI